MVGATLTNGKYAAQHGLTTTTTTPGHRCAHRNTGGGFSRLPDDPSVQATRTEGAMWPTGDEIAVIALSSSITDRLPSR
jgi:hypothetical protein